MSTFDVLTRTLSLDTRNENLAQEVNYLRARIRQLERSREPTVYNGGHYGSEIFPDTRALVNDLETELYETKSRASREFTLYRREISKLRNELTSSAHYQRNLNKRIDQLTGELAVYKRG